METSQIKGKLATIMVASLLLSLLFGPDTPSYAAGVGGRNSAGSSSAASGSVSQGGDGSVDVAVTVQSTSASVDGSSSGGGTVSSQAVTASMHPVCWYM